MRPGTGAMQLLHRPVTLSWRRPRPAQPPLKNAPYRSRMVRLRRDGAAASVSGVRITSAPYHVLRTERKCADNQVRHGGGRAAFEAVFLSRPLRDRHEGCLLPLLAMLLPGEHQLRPEANGEEGGSGEEDSAST